MQKRKKVLIIFFIFTIMLIIVIKQLEKNENFRNDSAHEKDSQFENDPATGLLSEEEKSNISKQLKEEVGNKKDKVVLMVNGEEITEKEIAYTDFRLNNEYVNKTGKKIDATEETIKRYVIYQDAQKSNISLTDEEIENIKNRIKNDKETGNLAKALNLSYNNYCEMEIKRTIILEINSMWHEKLLASINENKLEFYNESFKNKYEEYNESRDIQTRTQLLTELIDMYKEHLIDQADIKAID